MQPSHQHQRLNLAELKMQIVKKLGPEGSNQYFYLLNRFLSFKLNKVDFNKLCLHIVGRANVPLHNEFIHSILKNAFGAKAPPSHDKVETKEAHRDVHNPRLSKASALSNGYIVPSSPQEVRRGTLDRKVLDCPSDFGANGKTNFVSRKSTTEHDIISNVILENGLLNPSDTQTLMQHHQGLEQLAENDGEISRYHSVSLPGRKRLPDASVLVHNKDSEEGVNLENGKQVSARSLLQPPLGVPLYTASVGGPRRVMPSGSTSNYACSYNSGCLLDTSALKERMEQISATQGLERVTMDCANLLNNGLDAYLKGLISSCIGLVGARSGNDPAKSSKNKQWPHLKLPNGVRPGHHHHMQFSSKPMEVSQAAKASNRISLRDFRAAMEVNPQQLGEDWPLLLERICTNAFDE